MAAKLAVFAIGIFFLASVHNFSASADIIVSDSEETAEERCSRIQGKIDDLLDDFEDRRDDHMDAYDSMKDRVEKIEEKFKSAGYDTVDFEAETNIFSAKIENFSDDYADFFEKLTDVRGYVCDHTDSESRDELKDARTLLETVQEDAASIRNYYKNTLRPDIERFKNAAPAA